MEINGKRVAVVNNAGYSVSTRTHTSCAESAARYAGFLVIPVNEGIGDTRDGATCGGMNSDTTDAEILELVRENFKREHDSLVDDIAEISYRVRYSHSVTWLRKRVRRFNATLTALGLPELSHLFLEVPESHWRDARRLGLARERASSCHWKRKQGFFRILDGVPSVDFPCYPKEIEHRRVT